MKLLISEKEKSRKVPWLPQKSNNVIKSPFFFCLSSLYDSLSVLNSGFPAPSGQMIIAAFLHTAMSKGHISVFFFRAIMCAFILK